MRIYVLRLFMEPRRFFWRNVEDENEMKTKTTKKPSPRKPSSVRLNTAESEQLGELAKRFGISRSAYLRHLIALASGATAASSSENS